MKLVVVDKCVCNAATIARSHVAASLGYTPDLHEGQIEEKFMKQAREYIKSHHGKVIESTGNTRYRLLLKQAASSSGTADIADAIIASAKETGAALICVSRNQKSVLQSYFVGSTSEEVLRKSSVPTLLFPGVQISLFLFFFPVYSKCT